LTSQPLISAAGEAGLAGKVCIVTGASSGIGRATVLALLEAGASVAGAARRIDRLDDLAREAGAHSDRFLAVGGDLAWSESTDALITQTVARFGGIDILVNNAGVMLPGAVATADPKDWRKMFDLNVLALMHLSRAVLPPMRDRGGGHIVQVSSVAGRGGQPGLSGYCATKWAVNGFSECLRQEVMRDRIRVTVIEPGLVATELPHQSSDPRVRAATESAYAAVQNLEPADIAQAIVFAVSRPTHVAIAELLIRPLGER
jgi:NADP-dependent 3-hydroxy acid dehydrogenase YdfG